MYLLTRSKGKEEVILVRNFRNEISRVRSFLRIPIRKVIVEDRFLDKYVDVTLVFKDKEVIYIFFDSDLRLDELEQRAPLPIRVVEDTRKSTREIENEVLHGDIEPEKYLESGFFGDCY